MKDDIGEGIVARGHEYGTNSGRKRRPGWFDAVMMRHAVQLNTLTELAIIKLDIFDPLPTLKVCVAYEIDGRRVEHHSAFQDELERAVPIYVELPGWETDTTAVRTFDELPERARAYVRFLAEQSGVPVTMLGVGPSRDEIIHLPAPVGAR